MSVSIKDTNTSAIALTILSQRGFELIGWGLLLLAALLTGCGPAQAVNQPPAPPATLATSTPTSTPLPAPTSTEPALSSEATAVSPTADNSIQDSLPKPELTAKIGKITFAMEATDQREPINPGLLFSQGITQVHAIFDYSGMSPAYTWERVWRLNDKEVARKADIWTGPENGRFDYFIDNRDRPLPPGDWVLEIYVEGKLLSLGAFVIEEPAKAGASEDANQ